MKKFSVLIIGCILLSPIFFALCSDSLTLVALSIIYGFVLWISPEFSPKVRKFWQKFYKINLEWMQE